MKDNLKDAFNLMVTLKDATSPFHTVKNAAEKLKSAGFEELEPWNGWELNRGGRYYVNIYDTTIFAFTIGENYNVNNGMRLAAAHTDWPCLRVKPSPDIVKNGYAALNVEVYGGPILNTWLDRPLSIAGRITVKGENEFSPKNIYVDFKRSILTIPNLAIHLNKEVNKGVELNRQIDLSPVIGMINEQLTSNNYFINMLADEAEIDAEDILFFDLYIYNTDAGHFLGMNAEFISSPRLDDTIGVEACINGILKSDNADSLNIAVLFDNEEIGSCTKQGAGSVITSVILEKIMEALSISRQEYLSSLFKSIMLSVDVAHGIHPNHPEKYDLTSTAVLNKGIVIKTNSNQSYATDGASVGIVKAICDNNNIPYQMYANRSDVAGGSTLGSIAAAFTAVQTVDIGVPILAMHSARELMGAMDMTALNKLLISFFNTK